MTRLIYIANIRLPTEKAHGLQIMQNCEAFADTGVEVELWTAGRINTPQMRAIADAWSYYGVKRNFVIRHIPCLDLLPLFAGQTGLLTRFAFYLQTATFTLMMLLRAFFSPADIYYSRDPIVLLVLSFIKSQHSLAYEAHMLAAGRGGRWLQHGVVECAGTIIPVTKKLGDALALLVQKTNRHTSHYTSRGAISTRPITHHFLVAHDGIRRERFANMPSQADARTALNWPQDAFIVGYIGRLQTMSADKGVGTLIEALRQVEGATLALVGGPDDIAENLRQQWVASGMEAARFINAGQVTPDRVPLYLAALDVCVMPLPWTEHFAYYASPMKLFEYMASRRAIVASNLPSTAEVVTNDESALLYPPGDIATLATAVTRLRDNPTLRQTLAAAAYEKVMAHYTWSARAQAILSKITSDGI